MKKAATWAIAELIPDSELREDYVIPGAFDPNVVPAVAAAVAKAAMDSGVARIKVDPQEVYRRAAERTKRFREQMAKLLEK